MHSSHHNHLEHHVNKQHAAHHHAIAKAVPHIHSVHDKHAGHHTQDFLKRFWICLIVTIPVLLLSHMIQQWFGFEMRFAGDKYVLLLLASFIYIYGGLPFLKGLVSEVKDKAIGMMTLV